MKQTIFLAVMLMYSILYAQMPSAESLIREYSNSQDKIYNSYIQKIHCTVTWKAYEPERGSTGRTYINEKSVEKRSDGERYFSLTKTWGERPNTPATTVEHANHNYSLWDMNKYYHYTYHPDNTGLTDNGVLMINPLDNSKNTYTGICNLAAGGEIGGFFYGDDIRIDEELMRATKVSVLSEMQKINDTDCYVIMAEGNGCKYKLFLSPEHGYNILKATIERDWWSAGRPEYYSSPPPKGESRTLISDVKLKKINDIWVVEEAMVDQQYSYELGNHGETKKFIKVEELIMNPDHKALDSFGLSFIRDGAFVHISGICAIRYAWQNGELIPRVDEAAIDQLDKMTDEIIAEGNMGETAPKKAITEESITLDTILAEYRKTQKQLGLFYCEGLTSEDDKQVTDDLYTCNETSLGVQIQAENKVIDAFTWDGKKTVYCSNDSVQASSGDEKACQLRATAYAGSPLLGYLKGQSERVDLLLSKVSKKATVSQEKLGGETCYVVTAPIGQESWRVWFSPEQGYHVVKAEVQKSSKTAYLLDQVTFKTIDNISVPVSCAVKNSSRQYTYERTKIDLKPDFTAIKAFESAISDGTNVTVEGMTGSYYWENGNVVDGEGKNVF